MIKFLNQYAICAVFGIFALIHFVVTETTHLTPWKGGGYGMYSEYHPTSNQIWVETSNGRFSITKLTIKSEIKNIFEGSVSKCLAFPNTKNLSRLKELIIESGYKPIKIEVWRPDFDLETKEYSRVIVAEYEG